MVRVDHLGIHSEQRLQHSEGTRHEDIQGTGCVKGACLACSRKSRGQGGSDRELERLVREEVQEDLRWGGRLADIRNL